MKIKTESEPPSFARAIAMGVLLSLLFFYSIHVFGDWEIENYRPNTQTTYTLLLHNKCAVFGHMHTLRPNTGISTLSNGVDGTKLSGSFMNFTDGHIAAMIVFSLLLGGIIFLLRNRMSRSRRSTTALQQ